MTRQRTQDSVGFIFDATTFSAKEVEYLYTNGRHYNCLRIVTCVDSKQIPACCRINFDYVFISNGPNEEELQVLFKQFIDKPDAFSKFQELVKNNDILVYDRCEKSDNLVDVYSKYEKLTSSDPLTLTELFANGRHYSGPQLSIEDVILRVPAECRVQLDLTKVNA